MAALAPELFPVGENLRVCLEPVTDEVLAGSMYLQLLHDGVLQQVFYREVPSLSEFLSWLKRPDYLMVVALTQEPAQVIGAGWLLKIQGMEGCRRANLGIGFLRRFQRRALTVPAARQFLAMAFDQVNLDAVFGEHAVEGRAGMALAKYLGFEFTPALPFYMPYQGQPSSTVISWMTRERFRKKGKQK